MNITNEIEAGTPLISQEQIDKIVNALQDLAEAIIKVWRTIVDTITALCKALSEAMREFLKQTNPKLFYLAFNHKKYKVRKKNKARLFKLFKKLIKYG